MNSLQKTDITENLLSKEEINANYYSTKANNYFENDESTNFFPSNSNFKSLVK